MIRFCDKDVNLDKNDSLYVIEQKEYVVLDDTIWEKSRKYFSSHKTGIGKIVLLPVLNAEYQLICYAWQDEEADREIRMLRELEECENAVAFQDLYPEYSAVTIHGFNELAWHMANYFIRRNIVVNLDGNLWDALKVTEQSGTLLGSSYEIWAEGVHQKKDLLYEHLRSVSSEFECVDEIYEENIKAGKITNAEGNVNDLLERLKNEKIVIRGIGTKAQEAYDWLLSNGIDICAFQSDRWGNGRKLFGKPVKKKAEIMEQYAQAVIVECSSKYSAWGFGDVDAYDYEDIRRNKHYILLRDYIEVPEDSLIHILKGKNLILTGDICLCNKIYRLWKAQGRGHAVYWDILEENESEIEKLHIPQIMERKITENDVYMLVVPEYSSAFAESADRRSEYIDKFKMYGIDDYTEYFSNVDKFVRLDSTDKKYEKKELRPLGILLGAIPGYSGNVLFKQILEGHPQIMMLNHSVGFLQRELYSICVRLAEKSASDILSDFWTIYQREAGDVNLARDFPEKGKFQKKMEELLALGDRFTSQELFVAFHIAYNVMQQGKEELEKSASLENTIIYWEPHDIDREIMRDYAWWLGSDEVSGFTVCTVRNRYINAGSAMKWKMESKNNEWTNLYSNFYRWEIAKVRVYRHWEERTIKFEDLKCNLKEILPELCSWLGIFFDESLMTISDYFVEEGSLDYLLRFDTKPAYDLYEQYFTVFDRMRISLLAGFYQKKYGYPYISCMDFSRRELQEMFLKQYRWEKLPGAEDGKNEINIFIVQRNIRKRLWQERFAEIMKIEIDEFY